MRTAQRTIEAPFSPAMESVVADTVLWLLERAKVEPGNSALKEAVRTARHRTPRTSPPDNHRDNAVRAISLAQEAADAGAQDAPQLLHSAKIATALWLKARA